MSKSVDETVFDFFELLLHEAEPETDFTGVDLNHLSAVTAHVASATGHASSIAALTPELSPVLPRLEANSPAYETPFEDAAPSVDKQALEKLLAPVFTASLPASDAEVTSEAITAPETVMDAVIDVELSVEPTKIAEQTQAIAALPVEDNYVLPTQVGSVPPSITQELQQLLDDEFQVLFFKVAGLTLAVPLVSLGGIVNLERVNHIIGRPNWFLGVQTHREKQLNLVDTCAWVMPERYQETLTQAVNYQYIVLLEGSNWGLACESLVNTVKIDKSQVNWRSKVGKRPWLAGVVKEQMCGILHVQALIRMLDAGLGCQDSIN